MSSVRSSDDEATAVLDSRELTTGAALEAAQSVVPPGVRLGRYLVIDELGRGGMGVVLRGYDPKLQREVALKRVRTRTLDASARARLVREARAMAMLSHPNVVAVYDVDLGEGDVVVVMEYVPGTTLRRWLEAEPRSWRATVEALIAAGRGLAAAHDGGLLHRDFKLDNVLVGDDGRVRVTDFGLARSTESSRTSIDETEQPSLGGAKPSTRAPSPSSDAISVELTQAGVVMGTPPYMAPEQHEDGQLDARTDQYALCIALWRALTKSWPFVGDGEAGLLQAKRAGVPVWPADVHVPRHVVEAISRGLSPQAEDRWPSVPALLAELGRDPSRRQHRMLAIGVLALLAGGVFGMQSLRRARTLAACAAEGDMIAETWNDARADAIAAAFEATEIAYAADTWSRARSRIDVHAMQWQALRTDVCERARVRHTLSAEISTSSRSCLDEHREGLDALLRRLEAPDDTVVQMVARASASLPLLESCMDEVRLRQRGEPPSADEQAAFAALRARLASAAAARATGRYGEALTEAQAVLQEIERSSPLVADARLAVGTAQERLGEYESAAQSLQDAFFEAGSAGRDELALEAGAALVFVLGVQLVRHEEALYWGRITEMLVQRLALNDDLRVVSLLNHLAAVHRAMGDYAEATAFHERALSIRERILGSDHPNVAVSLNNLANVRRATGDNAQAAMLHERALAIREKTLGPDHPDVAMSLNNLAHVRYRTGDHVQAQSLFERALSIREKTLGPDHPNVASSLNNLANICYVTGDYEQAQVLFERARSIYEKALGPEHPNVATSLNNLANLRQLTGDYGQAATLYERALSILEKTLGPEHPDLVTSLDNLAIVYRKQSDYERAASLHARALTIREKILGPEHPDVAGTLLGLARVALARDRATDAVSFARRAVTLREHDDVLATDLAEARLVLARALVQAGQSRAQAVTLAEQARETYREAGDRERDALAEVEQWLRAHTGGP
jgi:eukaryotic-like serine/threonine-protein kinase